jgi:hypothetical protein
MTETNANPDLLAVAATYVDTPIFRLAAGRHVTNHYALPAGIYLAWTSPLRVVGADYIDGAPWTSEDPHVLAAANAMLVAVIVSCHAEAGRRAKLQVAKALSHAAMEIIRTEMAGQMRPNHIHAADRAFAFAKAIGVAAQQREGELAGPEETSEEDDGTGWENFVSGSTARKSDQRASGEFSS